MLNFVKEKKIIFQDPIASLPTIFVGFFLVLFDVAEKLRSTEIIAWTTIIFAILSFISDRSSVTHSIKKLSYKDVLIIGLFQVLSLIQNKQIRYNYNCSKISSFDRVSSAKVSFLISIPTLAVSVYGFYKLYAYDETMIQNVNMLSLIFSFIFSYITISLFLKYIKKI